MTSQQSLRRIPLIGIVLIAVGLLLLAEHIGMLRVTFWNVIIGLMIIYGAILVIRSFSGGERGKVFWGTMLFFFGIYFLLENLNLVNASFPIIGPVLFLIFGFSFLMMYLYRPSDWHLIIPTLFFLGIGGLIIAEEYSLIQAIHYERYIRMYWPLLLILFGLGLIIKARRRRPVAGAHNTVDGKSQ
jgi:hypothetical protein